MLRADPVMDTDQPGLEISKDEMDDGQELFGLLRDPHIQQWRGDRSRTFAGPRNHSNRP